jgi:hypothetical protein
VFSDGLSFIRDSLYRESCMFDVFVTFLFRNPLIYGVKLAVKMNRAEPRH